MNLKTIIPIIYYFYLFIQVHHNASLGIIDDGLTVVLIFRPNMHLTTDEAILNANTVSLTPTPGIPDLDQELTSFSFCFGYVLDFLRTQNLFSEGAFGFKINNPIEGYGFLTLRNGRSYLFETEEMINPATWHGVCISKVPINEGQGSHIRLLHDNKTVLDLTFPEEPYNMKLVDFYKIKYGVDYAMVHSATLEECLYSGKITHLCLTSKAQLTPDILEFTLNGATPFECKLWDIKNTNLYYFSNETSVSMRKQHNLTNKSRFMRSLLYINKYVNQESAWRTCKLINGNLTSTSVESDREFIWTHFRKYNETAFEGNVDENKINWKNGQPNGGMAQPCLAYFPMSREHYDMECSEKLRFVCSIFKFWYFVLRGICDENLDIEHYYYLNVNSKKGTPIFNGLKNNIIESKDGVWRITSVSNPKKVLAYYNGTEYFPVGLNYWYVTGYCKEEFRYEVKTPLKLSKCNEHTEFTCNDGNCVSMDHLCDNYPNCEDSSDEKYCSNVETINYRKEFPPSLKNLHERAPILIQFFLNSIIEIQELEDEFTILFDIQLDWEDQRLNFMRLKPNKTIMLTDKEKSNIWIPMLIFINSVGNTSSIVVDRFARVSIKKKEGYYGRLNPKSRLYEALIFNGREATISYNRVFDFPFHCNFVFEFYPFDTQICKIEVALISREQEKMKLVLMNGESSIRGNLESIHNNIQQFYIARMYTKIERVSKEEKVVVYIVLKRLFTNILVTTYIPTFFLQFVSLYTLFISEERFDTIVMVTLTTTLVMYTLQQSVSSSLPKTAYNKMIDYWIFFSLIMPFFVFVLEILIELTNQSLKTNPTSFKKSLKTFLINKGKFIMLTTTIIFDFFYWLYNISHY